MLKQAPTPPVPPPQSSRSWGKDFAKQITQGVVGEVRGQLQKELAKATAQRAQLQVQLANAPESGPAHDRIQANLDNVDRQIEGLQRGIEKLAEKEQTYQGDPGMPQGPPLDPADILPIVATSLGIVFIGFPLALAFARLLWKRATAIDRPPQQIPLDTARRFDELEQAVDSIAIEIERISENQRYL